MSTARVAGEPALVTGGIDGLDDILGGGLTPNRLYLIEGDPGAGKTTLGLQILLEGARRGERGIYVSLSETKQELEAVAASHGWSLAGILVIELTPSEDTLAPDAENTMFHPSEFELGEATRLILREVERTKPSLVVFDSLSEMRLLAQSPLRYRRQILALKQFFIGRQCTVLLLDDRTSEVTDLQLQSIAHGVISLERHCPEYGVMQRRLQVLKMRGKAFRAGYHDFTIARGGLRVYPRLVAAEHRGNFEPAEVKSGIAALDAIMGGGLDKGTSTLIMGPAGSGKSTLATQYAVAAAERGEHAALFLFEESIKTFLARSGGLGLGVQTHLAAGRLTIRQVDPGEISPGEFVHAVRLEVEQHGATVVMIDSLNGYLNAMPEVRFLTLQLHELLTYLGQWGVTSLLIVAQHGLVGNMMQAPVDASYLADSVLLLRFFESAGEVRQALSVLKKRSGAHERTIREFRLGKDGIAIGKPLAEFQGVLTGIPSYVGEAAPLKKQDDNGHG
jgi:circadian clock protein KaiC